MKMAEKGMIQASVALPAILEGMNDRFGGLMARQSQTFTGQVSNLKDQLFFTMQDLGAALLPLAKDVMDNFIKPAVSGLQSLAEWFQGLSGPTKNAIIVIGGVVAAAGPLLAAIGSMTSGIAALIPMFPAIASGVTAVTAAMGPWGIALGAVTAALIIYRDEIAAGIRSTLEFLNVIDDLPEVVGKNQTAYRRIADELKVSTETLDRFAAGNKNAIAILGKHKDEIAELQARLKNHTITQEQYERQLRKMIESQGSAAKSTNTVRTSIVNIETETGKHKKGVKELTTAYDEWMKRHPDFTEFLNRQRQAEEALGNELIKNAELIDEEKRKREEALVPLEALTSGTKALDSAIIPLNSDIWKQVGATQEAAAKTHELGATVSTTLTGMTQAIADQVTQWAGPFQSFASGALSALMEGLFKPLIDQMTSVGNSIGNWLSGLLSGKGGGLSLGNLIPGGDLLSKIPGLGFPGGTAAAAAGAAPLTMIGAGTSIPLIGGGSAAAATGTGAAAGGGSFMGSMGALMTNPWMIGIGAAAGLGYLGYKWATGPDSYEAGSKEIMRDFGVSVSDSQVKELFKAVGIDDGDAWDYRKELLSSPAAMAAFLAAGKTPDMAKMANLQAYGSGHDFSGALQAAAGGDWKPYNDLYKRVFRKICGYNSTDS